MIYDWTRNQAERDPNRIAVTLSNRHLSYEDLEVESNRLAGMLLLAGLKTGDKVGLMVGKTFESITAILGITKAGGIYVPLNRNWEEEHLVHLLQSSHINLLLVDHHTWSTFRKLTSGHGRFRRIPWAWWSREPEPEHSVAPAFVYEEAQSQPDLPYQKVQDESQPAHILYLPGPSGSSRAMQVTHGEIRTFIDWAVSFFEIKPEDRISGYSELHSELSTFDLYGSMAAGAHLYLTTPDVSSIPKQLASFILENDLTQWFSPPAVLNNIARYEAIPAGGFPGLERLIWSGKVFPVPALRYWMKRLPEATFTNLYGPTDSTLSGKYYSAPRQAAHPARHRRVKSKVTPPPIPELNIASEPLER